MNYNTIQEYYNLYIKDSLPEKASDELKDMVRQTFFCGAQAVMSILSTMDDQMEGEMSEEAAMQMLLSLQDEVTNTLVMIAEGPDNVPKLILPPELTN